MLVLIHLFYNRSFLHVVKVLELHLIQFDSYYDTLPQMHSPKKSLQAYRKSFTYSSREIYFNIIILFMSNVCPPNG